MENNTNSNNKNLISDAVVIEFLHTVRDVLITFIVTAQQPPLFQN